MTPAAADDARRRRLLAVGPALDQSSYCRVIDSTLRHLPGWEIDQLGVNYRGELRENGWRIHPNRHNGDRYGIAETIALAQRIAPDVAFVFNSFLGLPRYWELPSRLGPRRPALVAQCPLLGEAVDPRLVGRLAFFDRVAVLSHGVKRHFEDCLSECVGTGYVERAPQIDVVPHGVDASLFYMRDSETRQHLKRSLFGPEASFVVLNANRREPRKRIDLTLLGFAQFARDKPPGVRLHLHMDDGPEPSLSTLACELGIADRVTIAASEGHPQFTDWQLNDLYNACDVGLNTAAAEGFGMTSLEHAATGAAQIVPGHGVCAELWRDSAEVLAATPLPDAEVRYTRQSVVAAADLAAALQRLYECGDYRIALAEKGRRNALRPALQWAEIGRQWNDIFERASRERRATLVAP